ncbi:allene oxide cyclase barrel-like domain-containing protein [Actinophytocola glycyrrhizae]|uniref:Allene oxide cyclase barrel-like domain-containing protein n=1 Tax=Actinophytocola glycyrrhizae TaxID=2044873 RepID=A0ABV9RWH8_9PSEU
MRIKPWHVLVLAGALLSAGAVSAGAAGGPRADTVEVVAKRTLMSASANPAVGSGFVAGGDLLDEQGRAKVGEGFSHCGVVSVSLTVPPAVTAHCTSVFRLKDGELHLSGLRTYKALATGFDDTALAVVGGTGAYANARGDGKVTRTSGHAADVSYRFTFTVVTD